LTAQTPERRDPSQKLQIFFPAPTRRAKTPRCGTIRATAPSNLEVRDAHHAHPSDRHTLVRGEALGAAASGRRPPVETASGMQKQAESVHPPSDNRQMRALSVTAR
jgi:hypothetical protein